MKVLVIGNSTRSVVCSAKKAGYTVYALDRFGDVDMQRCADSAGFIETEDRIYELSHSFGEFDAVILGPGYEKLKFKNVLNNKIEVMEEVNDKLKIAEKLNSMGIPHPGTEPLKKALWHGHPLMIKPRSGSGGIQNVRVKSEEELAFFKERTDADAYIAQEFVDGVPCSASLIGTGNDAAVVAVNEQLIGIPWLTRLPFAYCGNITPFHTAFDNEMINHAKQISLEFGLLGSNGVDFILNRNGVVVLEVNPRFQGSMDTVERSCGINIFDAHVRSFAGELPEPKQPVCFAAKAIVYADKKVIIDRKISQRLIKCMNEGRVADIPQAGWVVRPDDPVTTIIETGETREIALEKAWKSGRFIKDMTEA